MLFGKCPKERGRSAVQRVSEWDQTFFFSLSATSIVAQNEWGQEGKREKNPLSIDHPLSLRRKKESRLESLLQMMFFPTSHLSKEKCQEKKWFRVDLTGEAIGSRNVRKFLSFLELKLKRLPQSNVC